jgi:ADP-heptose:LPS heptosyltransferase
MRILAINFGGLGDEILFLPTLKSIRSGLADCRITLLTEPRSRSIAGLTSLIDDNIVFDIKKKPLLPSDYLELVLLLRAGKYDTVISSGSSTQVAMLLFLSGIKRRVGYDSGLLSRILLSRAVPLNREQYAADMYHDLVRGLDISLSAGPPQIEVSESALASMQEFLAQERRKATRTESRQLVLIHPGSSRLALQKGIIKTWAGENWCEMVRRLLLLDCEVLLCGGPDDDDTIRDITAALDTNPAVPSGLFINAYGRTASIKDLAALMQLAGLVVCVDSAPMHMAAALSRRVVALFGPTDPAKLLPASDRSIAIREAPPPAGQSDRAKSGLRIPLDLVYQAAVDQLQQASRDESCPILPG